MKMTDEQAQAELKAFAERCEGMDRFAKEQYEKRAAMGYKAQLFRSPVDLPERKIGKVFLKHGVIKAGETFDIVSMREAYHSGKRPVRGCLKHDLRIHKLGDKDNGVWMTDHPTELNQMAEGVHETAPHGRVLVGGLGLGILAGMLRDHKRMLAIKNITVVERNETIVKLCDGGGYDIAQDDIFKYLETGPEFDCYMLDTWQGQNESTYWEHVLPQQRIIRNRFPKARIWCWKEDEMQGQVYMNLRGPHKHWHYANLPQMTHEEATFFLTNIGSPEWEEKYGKAIKR